MSGEQDIRVSYAGRWKAQVFITDDGRCTAAQWWGTDRDLIILESLPTLSVSHLSLCACLWPRRRFLTSVHLLPYWNQHLRHIGAQDGEVGREIILIYSLSLSLSLCGCDICFRSSKWVFSVFSVCETGFIETLMIQGIHNFCVYMSALGILFGFIHSECSFVVEYCH